MATDLRELESKLKLSILTYIVYDCKMSAALFWNVICLQAMSLPLCCVSLWFIGAISWLSDNLRNDYEDQGCMHILNPFDTMTSEQNRTQENIYIPTQIDDRHGCN